MKEVAISEFKAKCLAILDEVQKTKQPIRVTRRGRPIAEVSPPSPTNNRDWMGSMKGDGDSWRHHFSRQVTKTTGRFCAIETSARYSCLAVESAQTDRLGTKTRLRVAKPEKRIVAIAVSTWEALILHAEGTIAPCMRLDRVGSRRDETFRKLRSPMKL